MVSEHSNIDLTRKMQIATWERDREKLEREKLEREKLEKEREGPAEL